MTPGFPKFSSNGERWTPKHVSVKNCVGAVRDANVGVIRGAEESRVVFPTYLLGQVGFGEMAH